MTKKKNGKGRPAEVTHTGKKKNGKGRPAEVTHTGQG